MLDGIREDRFYVLTDEDSVALTAVHERLRAIVEGKRPRPPPRP
jgi:hypothetical protein